MKQCAIYGKGPSLFTHDFNDDPVLRIAINDAGYIVPGVSILMMHDYNDSTDEIIRRTVSMHPDVKVFLPTTMSEKFTWINGINDKFVWYEHGADPDCPEHQLYHGNSTGCAAVGLAHRLQCTHVKMIGFDGVATTEEYGEHWPIHKEAISVDPNWGVHQSLHYAKSVVIMNELITHYGMEKL